MVTASDGRQASGELLFQQRICSITVTDVGQSVNEYIVSRLDGSGFSFALPRKLRRPLCHLFQFAALGIPTACNGE